jgi:hypothetical protein
VMVLALIPFFFLPTRKMIHDISHLLPSWTLAVNLCIQPFLIALAVLPDRMRPELRLVFVIMFLASLSLNRLSWDRHGTATLIVTVVDYATVFWIIPKRETRGQKLGDETRDETRGHV